MPDKAFPSVDTGCQDNSDATASSFDQLLSLATHKRRKNQRQSAILFLTSMYQGFPVCLSHLGDFSDEDRHHVLEVFREYMSEPHAWIMKYRRSIKALPTLLESQRFSDIVKRW